MLDSGWVWVWGGVRRRRGGGLERAVHSVHKTFFSLKSAETPNRARLTPQVPAGYAEALANVDFNEIQDDIKRLMNESKPEWPADYGHYGPFFIRLAWHCAGS